MSNTYNTNNEIGHITCQGQSTTKPNHVKASRGMNWGKGKKHLHDILVSGKQGNTKYAMLHKFPHEASKTPWCRGYPWNCIARLMLSLANLGISLLQLCTLACLGPKLQVSWGGANKIIIVEKIQVAREFFFQGLLFQYKDVDLIILSTLTTFRRLKYFKEYINHNSLCIFWKFLGFYIEIFNIIPLDDTPTLIIVE